MKGAAMLRIKGYDHIGIRVTERHRALDFYAQLGFLPEDPEAALTERAVNLVTSDGVRINLICNGTPPPYGKNVLMDVENKWPGITHPAFIVASLDAVLEWAGGADVAITEGPVVWDDRRRVCFLRDPDGNVLEFDELFNAPDAGPRGAVSTAS
jgi:catechol 2,3-dioxygenase-like lactoylglutathione lyase family enzyme